MKVKDLIAKLQTMDQEAYIDLGTGALVDVIQQEGYFDGSYAFMDGDTLCLSTTGNKVSFFTRNIDEQVSYLLEQMYSDEEVLILTNEQITERLKPYFRCDFTNFVMETQRIEKEQWFGKTVERSIQLMINEERSALKEDKNRIFERVMNKYHNMLKSLDDYDS